MKKSYNSLTLGAGNISFDKNLGKYYQDISPSLIHLEEGVFGSVDEKGIPYLIRGEEKSYAPITIIQYALANYDLFLENNNSPNHKEIFINNLKWLIEKSEDFKDSIVIRLKANKQYNIPEGWISGMVQSQFISILLRGYQLLNDETYLELAKKAYNSFAYKYEDGGFKRIDESGCIWFEEYNTDKPSLVLNGFIYSMFGILDYYRVTDDKAAIELWNQCLHTLEVNLYKYDKWYWSVYDQQKRQLVSYYYQKNVHVPLMQIMFQLTKNDLYKHYADKWEKNLKNFLHLTITKIMYRVQPRIRRLKNKQ